MKRTVFITGATSGIGEATAHIFANDNYRLIICGRREDRLAALKERFAERTEVHTLSFDVRDRKAVKQSIDALPDEWKEVDILVNNAGNAHGLGAIYEGDLDDWDAMIDINVKGLLYVSRHIIPGMVERKRGHIVNIGSVAGYEAYPGGNVYNASKFAVRALNKAMRLDLYQHNVKVSSINPGLVETEFSLVRFKGDQEKAEKVYKGFEALQALDIADAVYYVTTRPDHVNIEDINIFPTAQGSGTRVHKK